MQEIDREYYDPPSAADLLGMSVDDLWHLIEIGKLEASIRRSIVDTNNYDFYDLSTCDNTASSHTFELSTKDALLIVAMDKAMIEKVSVRMVEPYYDSFINAHTGVLNEVFRNDWPVPLYRGMEITKDQIVIAPFAIGAFKDRISSTKPIVEQEKELPTKERNIMLRIIAALAIGGYKYPAHGSKAEMLADFDRHGMPIDEKTLTKYLKQAEQYSTTKPR